MWTTRKVLETRGEVKLTEETLSDGSKVYDIDLGGAVTIHAIDDVDAMKIFRSLSARSITVWTD